MGQRKAQGSECVADDPSEVRPATGVDPAAAEAFDAYLAARGHMYRETPAVEGLVDASCSCRGWELWERTPGLAVVAWRMHASGADER